MEPHAATAASWLQARYAQPDAPPLRCRIKHAFPTHGLGSVVRLFLETVLLPAVRAGLSPGSIDVVDDSFWYSCSATRGWTCYFEPALPSPAARVASTEPIGAAASQRVCSAQSLRQLNLYRGNGSNTSLSSVDKLGEAREAMRPFWVYTNSTQTWLREKLPSRLHRGSKPPVLLSVHLRRGDKGSEEWQNNFTLTPIDRVAERVRQEVARAQLSLDKMLVHIMSDDSRAARELSSRLNLSHSSVIMRPQTSSPATGFDVCLSPRRFGKGACACTLEDSRGRLRHDPHWAARCLVRRMLITKPLTFEQIRDEMRGILFDIEIAKRATLFLGPCNSNTGHLVQLLRTQRADTAICLDTPSRHVFIGVCEDQNCDIKTGWPSPSTRSSRS